MKLIIAVTVAAALVGAYFMTTGSISQSQTEDMFASYVAEYRKSYFSVDEYQKRLDIFAQTLKKIDEQNSNPNDQAVYGINHLSDWTEEEFSQLLGIKDIPEETETEEVGTCGVTDCREVDWRETEHLTPVKD